MTPNNQSGWQRHRVWLIPLGCLGITGCGCLGLVVILALWGVTGVFSIAKGLIQSTGTYQSYQIATERIKTDPDVAAALGNPVTPGWLSKSQEHYTDHSGQTCIRFAVSGSKSSGSVYVETILQEGSWQFYQLVLWVNARSQPIVLIAPPSTQPQSLCPDFDQEDETPEENLVQAMAIPEDNWFSNSLRAFASAR